MPHDHADHVNLPAGVRHLEEATCLQPGKDVNLPKTKDETMWHIVHAVSILLRKDFKAGVARYAASNQQQVSRRGSWHGA